MRKAFEKQIKTIENEGDRQIKQFRTNEKLKQLKNILVIMKISINLKKEILNALGDKRLEEIINLDKKVNSDDLICRCKCNTADEKFDQFDNAFTFLDKIRYGKTGLADAKYDEEEFRSNQNEIKNGTKNIKEQKNNLYNIEMLYKARNSFIEFFYDYSSVVSKT